MPHLKMKEEISDIVLHGLVTDLYKTERSIILHKRIGQHANLINASKSKIKRILILLQNLTFNEAILSLSRIYDTPDKKYPNRCVLRLIDLLKNSGEDAPEILETLQTREQLRYFRTSEVIVNSLIMKDKVQFTKYLVMDFEFDFIQPDFQNDLRELKRVRDKILAHNEMGNIVREIKWATFDNLILFVKKVIGIVGWAYLSTVYMQDGKHLLTEAAIREGFIIDEILKELNILNEA